MSQNVQVDRTLTFRGDAVQEANVVGPMMTVRKTIKDEFMGDTLDANLWTATTDGSNDTVAISEIAGGTCLITTGEIDDDVSFLSGPIIFNGSKKAEVEFRIGVTDISGTNIFVGFSDAKSETSVLAAAYPADALTATATDFAGFVLDPDHGASLMCVANADGTNDQVVDSGIDWEDNALHNLRVKLTDARADFFVDGIQKASIAAGPTAATLLCATVQAGTRADDNQNTVLVQRYNAWVDAT